MSDRFSTARHCHAVLSILLNDLHAQFDEDRQVRRRPSTIGESLQKRRRLDTPSSAISSHPKSPPGAQHPSTQVQNSDMSSHSGPTTTNEPRSMTEPLNQPRLAQPHHRQEQYNAMPWSDSMMSGGAYPDVGDVFGQVSWEVLFQGDGSGWEWENMGGI